MRQPEKMDVRAALPAKPIGFLDQLRVFIRSKGLAYTTEKTYVLRVRNFISFSKYQSPKDIDFANGGLCIMEAKGDKSRRSFLPNATVGPLKNQIESVKHLLESDKAIGKAGVYMPDALSQKWPKA